MWIVMLIVVIVAVGVYFYSSRSVPSGAPTEPSRVSAPAAPESATSQGDSELNAIEQELSATAVDELDAELGDIDKELQ